jgi:hypothetical protein
LVIRVPYYIYSRGVDNHIGVGSDVACSTAMGIPEPQMVERAIDVSTLFLCLTPFLGEHKKFNPEKLWSRVIMIDVRDNHHVWLLVF